MSSVLRISTVMVVVFALVAGLRGPRVFASTRIATDASTDRAALVALYEATDGDNWINRLNWLSDAPLGTWYGVTTDDRGRVIELDLSHNGLSGTIPPELGDLTNLKELFLAGNELRGAIPLELGKLTNLEWLFLGDNQLSATIPSEMSNLINLEWLNLWGNQLGGTIPSELGNLTNLTSLDLSGNELGGTIPSELGNLTNLTSLDLSGNELGGTIPSELSNLTHLIDLQLGGNRLRGTIPAELGKLTSLGWLRLWGNQLSGTIPSELGNLTNLITLNLSGNRLSGTIPSELGNLIDLEALVLSENYLSGTIPPELGNLTFLDELYLSGNELGGSIPSELGHLTNLIWLDLSKNRLGGTIPSELGDLTYLTELGLSDNRLGGTIPSELGNLTYLEELNLSSNELSGTIPPELGNLTDLEWLGLWDNRLSGTIPPELGNLTYLKGLGLWGNALSGTIPPELGNLPYLWILSLSSNQLSGTIPSELGNLTGLTQLFLSGNKLSGCVPAAWRNVEEGDLDELDLPYCTAQSPTPTAVAETLTRPQVFDKVSPAIAFIQTEIGSGSGILVEGGYVVTNAHVVWPFDAARVVFPDGIEFGQVPVKGWDLLADLAVLGPIDARAQAATLLDGESIPIGSDMYLIGYPGEVEAYPQPTSVSGSLSRLREWEPVGITYFQTPAPTADGQSGGALVSSTGYVIGISGFTIIEGKFVLSASSADLLPRIRQLIAGEDPSGHGERRLPLEGGVPRHELTLQNYGDAYILNEPVATAIEIELSGADEGRFRIFDAIGRELTDGKADSFSFVTKRRGPHFLVLSDSGSGKFTLSANRPLARFDDPDDSRRIQVGRSLTGNIDFPADIDLFFLRLEKDEKVEISARSALANTYLTIWDPIAEQRASDYNSGGGLFGEDAKIIFQAPQSGEYALSVRDVGRSEPGGNVWSAPGGYVISVKQAGGTDALTPVTSSTEIPETLTRPQVFDKVSPAIAFIETEIGSGSGVLVEGGYVVTNAHVVWPFDAARVVFPDGTEFGQVPVKGWDLLTDLAVLGPIDARAQAATLLDGESIPTGSDMYLIGYPGEVEAYPQPAFVPGSLSRLREWEPAGITYFQVDALIMGGQSGGALVSAAGEVIGISGFKFEEEFALAASSADIAPRIRQLIAGADPAGHGERLPPLQGGARRHELTLQSYGDAYILNEPAGTAIEFELSGADEGGFRVYDSLGYEISEDETASFSFETEYNGPHYLVVSDSGSGKLTLSANRPLARFDDPDDSRRIQVGRPLTGNVDFPADIDLFFLRLEKDEKVEISARSALANTYLSIWDPIAEQWASDYNSGGGLFGEDAKIIFQAPQSGEYALTVRDVGRSEPGGHVWSAPAGYVISVRRAGETDALTPLASSGTPTRPAPVVSIHNPLVIPIGDRPAVPAGDIHEWFPTGYEPPTGPTVTINGTMNVRGGPGTNFPIIGAATAGQQYDALSRNAAGDWWQIEYEGRLAWVYGGLVTASVDAANAPRADRSGWLTYEDEARGLSLSFPTGWRYFDPAQPSQADLALFSAARKGDEEQLDIAEMGAMVSAMSAGSEDAVVGLGLQADQANDASSNVMLIFSFAAGGLNLERYVQAAADRLLDSYGVVADSVELVPELRPLGEEAVSIRYRESETNSEVWQVWLLSPDEEMLLALAFSVHSDEFAGLEPLLREIVQKVQWSNQPAPSFPVVTVNGNMNVRGGPGTFYPVLGTAGAGEQFAITGKNPSGAWWRISYKEQPGWVFSQLVTASGPLENIPLVKAYDWDAFHDGERRLWVFYPPGWFFFDPLQSSEADRKSLGDLIGQEYAEQWLHDFAVDMDTGQKERYVGFGFKIASDSTAQIEVSAFAADGLALGQVMSIVQEGLRESGLDVDSAEMVTNLRYDGAGTVSIRYRDNRTGLGSERVYWQVWIVSPDQGTFLRISFNFQSPESAQLVPLLSEMVRRIRWE